MKIVHRLFFAFVGVCGVHGIAAAERWTVVGQTEKVVVHVDADSIAVKDGFRRAWEKWEYSEDRSPPPLTSVHKPFRTARYLTSYDCKARTSAELQAIFYERQWRDGREDHCRTKKRDVQLHGAGAARRFRARFRLLRQAARSAALAGFGRIQP